MQSRMPSKEFFRGVRMPRGKSREQRVDRPGKLHDRDSRPFPPRRIQHRLLVRKPHLLPESGDHAVEQLIRQGCGEEHAQWFHRGSPRRSSSV